MKYFHDGAFKKNAETDVTTLKSPWSSVYCVGLLDVKAWVRIPGQSSKMKYEKYFFGDFLSADFWQKI